MHDPFTVAFEIKSPFRRRVKLPSGETWHSRNSLVTVWHKDPCADGSDDSCGWFIRARHGSKETLKKIESLYRFEWCQDWGGWFNENGTPRLSPMAIIIQMFRLAAWEVFGHNWRRVDQFMRRNLHDILLFAENNIDSLHSYITGRYGIPDTEKRIEEFASIVYPYVMRLIRPWYQHPRWHFWHWRIQIPLFQKLERRVMRYKTSAEN